LNPAAKDGDVAARAALDHVASEIDIDLRFLGVTALVEW